MSQATPTPATQTKSQSDNWTSKQAYILAAFCLVLGATLGYLFRGSASPSTAAANAPAEASAGVPAGILRAEESIRVAIVGEARRYEERMN